MEGGWNFFSDTSHLLPGYVIFIKLEMWLSGAVVSAGDS
jgi:hypothetical protein